MTERDITELSREEVIREIFKESEDGWKAAEQLIELGLGAPEIVGKMQKENYAAVSNKPTELSVCKEKGDAYAVHPQSKIFQLESLP